VKLTFSFHDKLFWIQNFLSPSTYKELYLEIFNKRKEINFKDTEVGWGTYKEEKENMPISFDQNNEFNHTFFNKYHTLLHHQQFVNLSNCKSLLSHIRKYKYGQHTAWHSDTDYKNERKYAATYYFNHRWGESWGGELMFKSNLGSGFIPIVGNSVVIVKTGLMHKVNANLKKTHDRLSIQTWIS
jgi:Rps23 Pro-64 3,4-dihydroxylase Tpa1-like proline 4-hydroxylase